MIGAGGGLDGQESLGVDAMSPFQHYLMEVSLSCYLTVIM